MDDSERVRLPSQHGYFRCRASYFVDGLDKLFQAAYGYIQVFVFSTLYLAPAVYPIIFGFMLRDVQIFLRKLFSCFFTPEPEKCPDYSPSMQTRLTHASRTVTPMGTPELP